MSDAAPATSSRLAEVIRAGIDEPRQEGEPDPRWQRVRDAGTELWLDTGDVDEAAALWDPVFSALTTNNTLLNKEIQKGLYDAWIPEAAEAASADRPNLDEQELVLEIAFALNARHGLRLVERFGAQVSVELHTDLAHDVERSVAYGRRYAALCEQFIVKVPLTPEGLVAARRLGEEGIPVNFTLGFSARENCLITCVAQPSFVNVFLGRLNAYGSGEGLCDGRWVGERATIASQRAVAELRQAHGWDTRQIAASMRGAEQVVTLAGVDVFTMPLAVASGYLEGAPEEVADRTGEDYQPEWNEGVDPVAEGLNDLWTVTPEFRATCEALAKVPAEELSAEGILERLAADGHGAVFPDLSAEEHAEIRDAGKAPKRERWIEEIRSGRCGLDGLFTLGGLHAFAQDQAALDERIRGNLT